ncbi:MAG: deoxyribonuclease IV [Candidatus Nanohaloarchaea archaeon]|nr:deoxyribonuclease IV [Candidatus Nanohaloarchaea archaeon]
MLKIGAHVSVSGGFPKALERMEAIGGNCGQVFVHSPRGWSFSDLDQDEVKEFRKQYDERNIGPITVHSAYLINLATPKEGLLKKSKKALKGELERASKLGMEYVVFHPGSHTGAGVEQGIQNISDALSDIASEIPPNVKLLLENSAGAGTSLGRTAEELKEMIKGSGVGDDKLGVCIDTCHAFAAGYDIRSAQGVEEMVEDFEAHVGWENVPVIHLNDSKHPFDSNKDEHEHIGEGEIGDKGMKAVLNNEKIREKPLVLETPVDSKGYAENIEKAKILAGEQ